jgi:aminoglycoside phosphotransferase (APT) family kinase protein
MTISGIERETEHEVLAALRSFAELPAWLAQAMDPVRVRAELERHVPELATNAMRLVSCEPSRLRAKGDQWLARYELIVADADHRARDAGRRVALVGVLEPPGRGSQEPSAPAPVAVPFGHPDWVGWLPDLRLHLRTEISDDNLPALPLLTDPARARKLLEDSIGREAYPGIRVAECVPEVVRYKPGSRCTLKYRLRYHASDRGWPEAVVVKTHQGDKGANAFGAMQALWATDLAAGDVVAIAQPLAYLPDPRVLVQAVIPGEVSLKEAIRSALFDSSGDALRELRARLRDTARGLAALHQCGVRYGRVHTWDDELAEVREVVARLAATVPDLAYAADPLLDRLRVLAGSCAPDQPGPAHHDFRPAQVLLRDDGIGFIDFDGFCTAEPALDLGRFRAKLRDIGVFAKGTEVATPTGAALAGRLALLDELCEVFLAHYQQFAPVSRPRVLLWEALDLLTAVLHTWTKVRSARVAPRLALLEHHVRTRISSARARSAG